MNRNKLKSYASQARCDFIKAVTDQAAYYGLTNRSIASITEQGDVAIIEGKAFPRAVATKRKRLEELIRRQGFEQVMEAMAYTWFNRLVAIRFMELHGYLDHGYRVLSHPEGSATPEIVEHAEHVELPGLDREKVIELKLEGTKESELYRMLLIAQCNTLHKAMPFLFEWVDDETELLLPENLLHSDSVIRKLVKEIPEEEWKEVEIIGWLYQFYISEKQEQVIGKVVKSEDIPAATQRFTPKWIVKYLVQNSLGRQWIATYPNSPLKQQMEFYIEPAEQTPEVQEQLKAITHEGLNPEELTLLDPACGSGHILVEAYDLLKAIYQERGYRTKDISRLILEKNLYGLEIDDRAAQLAAFALIMKARGDDRRIFENGTKPHILAIQESRGLVAGKITEVLNAGILKTELPPREFLFEEMEDARTPLFSRKSLSVKGDIDRGDVAKLIDLFEHGKTFGSLIRVPEDLAENLHAIAERIQDLLDYGGMFEKAAARSIMPIVDQAQILAGRYDAVVTNPPYMGSKFYNSSLKEFITAEYKEERADLYACFIARNIDANKEAGRFAMITIPNWMFLSGFSHLRARLLRQTTIESFMHNGRGVWGSDFGSCCFAILNNSIPQYRSTFRKLFNHAGTVASSAELQRRFFETINYNTSSADFMRIPGEPIAYWVSERIRDIFASAKSLKSFAVIRRGLATGDNDLFIRHWWEVSVSKSSVASKTTNREQHENAKWFPYNKGGEFRKWYGNVDLFVNWENDGYEIRNFYGSDGRLRSRPQGIDFNFKPVISWSSVSISFFGVRLYPPLFVNDQAGNFIYVENETERLWLLAFLCSKLSTSFLNALNPSLNILVSDVGNLPIVFGLEDQYQTKIAAITSKLIYHSREDWNSFETSWDFQKMPLLDVSGRDQTVREWFLRWETACFNRISEVRSLEEECNRVFINLYGLEEELYPEVPEDQITLCRPDREEDIKRLISYAIGGMMGRYSLDKPGLIYAHSGNKGFDPSQYKAFPADQDGIVPITDTDWFGDDAANRVVEFIGVAWPKEYLEENLKFVAESIGLNRNESSRETIRRYLADGFFKHHLSMYKKRPIYWLFTSGKQRAFQCLVYLHRYNEGTLSRMRTEYVIPLQGKISARIDQLAGDIAAATSTSHRKKLEKERGRLFKQQAELRTFDENLRHYADQRISLDLDDGVKLNYRKFLDLLAEAKAVTGARAD